MRQSRTKLASRKTSKHAIADARRSMSARPDATSPAASTDLTNAYVRRRYASAERGSLFGGRAGRPDVTAPPVPAAGIELRALWQVIAGDDIAQNADSKAGRS
jgi:hypothetical protein